MEGLLREKYEVICLALKNSDESLCQLAIKFYNKRIIDLNTKNEVMQLQGRYDGPNKMMDYVKTRVDTDPSLFHTVLDVMEEVEILATVVRDLKRQWHNMTPGTNIVRKRKKDGDCIFEPPKKSSFRTFISVEKRGRDLQEEFEQLLLKTGKIIVDQPSFDVGELRTRLNWFVNLREKNPLSIEDYMCRLEELQKPSAILNFLIRHDFIGYLNYELLKLFQEVSDSESLQTDIDQYEEQYIDFLESNFADLTEYFDKHPPKFPLGLPKLTIHLGEEWKGKSMYDLREIIDSKIEWTSLVVTRIARGSILVTFCVYPVFLKTIEESLKTMLNELQKHDAEITIEMEKPVDSTTWFGTRYCLLVFSVLVMILSLIFSIIPMHAITGNESSFAHSYDLHAELKQCQIQQEQAVEMLQDKIGFMEMDKLQCYQHQTELMEAEQEKEKQISELQKELAKFKREQEEIIRLQKELKQENDNLISKLQKELMEATPQQKVSDHTPLPVYFKHSHIHNVIDPSPSLSTQPMTVETISDDASSIVVTECTDNPIPTPHSVKKKQKNKQ